MKTDKYLCKLLNTWLLEYNVAGNRNILYNCVSNTNSDLTNMNGISCTRNSTVFFSPHSERRAAFASQTSLTPLGGRTARNIPATLLLECKELVKSVRAILDMDCKFFHSFSYLFFG